MLYSLGTLFHATLQRPQDYLPPTRIGNPIGAYSRRW
jgi:hypothetical protein